MMEEQSKLMKISSLIGGIATHTLSGSILFYYTFIPYRYSYLKRLDTSLKSISLNYIIPVSFVFIFGFSWLGAFLERKTNPKVALFVGNFCIIISVGLLWLSKSAVVDYFLFVLYGIGIGINNLACKRFIFYRFLNKTKQGLILGISMSGYILACGLPIMVNLMINPEGARPSINFNGEGEYIYPIYITSRIKFFLIIYICVLSVLSLISILCVCNYDTEIREVDNRALFRKSNISNISTDTLNVPVEPLLQSELRTIFRSLTFYVFIMISILSTYGTFVCLFTFYEFGKYNFADSIILSYCPLGFILCCGLGHLIWGFLYDKLRYKMNMYIILGTQILLCILLNFSVKWSWCYFVVLSCLGFTYGGVLVTYSVYLIQFYGKEVGLEVYGIIGAGIGFSAIFSIGMVSILGTGSISFPTSCLTMYIVGAICNLICILFIIFPIDDLEIE